MGEADKFMISPTAADRLLAAHDGDMALLYLYLLRHGSLDPEDAARTLCRTLAEVEAAAEKLERMGIPEAPRRPAGPSRPIPEPADEPPEYNARDIVERGDPAFTALVTEAQKALGHALSTPDLKKLFGIYDYLRLPPEVIMMLLNHCVKVSKGRLPSMRFIEKEAYAWANREILTLEQAEEYIARSDSLREKSAKTAELLGIRGRELTATENRYISAWLEMGFGEDLIEMAYDRTVTNTGGLKWSYMNSILKSWHEKGLFTPADVREKDGRMAKQQPKQPGKPKDLDRLIAALDKI